MFSQVVPDFGAAGDNVDTQLAEQVRRAYPGQLQQLWRPDTPQARRPSNRRRSTVVFVMIRRLVRLDATSRKAVAELCRRPFQMVQG